MMIVISKRIRAAAAWLAVLLFLTFPTMAVSAEEETPSGAEDWIDIATPDELLDIRRAPSARYRLTADLDMSQTDWLPVAFSGSFDGGGHTIYNLNVTRTGNEVRTTADGNLKPYDTTFAGLFSTVENAVIDDLNLVGAKVSVKNEESCFAALLAGYAENSTISRCTVNGQVNMVSRGINVGIGGLAGYGRADFDGCEADVVLFFEDKRTQSRCEQFMGGLLASGTGNITHCTVTIDGYDSCRGYVHNGGMAGMYFNGAPHWRAGRVNHNTVKGRISFFEDNPDRRAYCSAYLGERLDPPIEMTGNTQQFTRDETTDTSVVLRPEKCDSPQYRIGVVPPTCTEWGHTEYLCQTCGHAWSDEYTPPRHTEGRWETVTAATEEREGLRQKHCIVCGQLLGEEVIPTVAPEHTTKRILPLIWTGTVVSALLFAGVIAGFAMWKKRRRSSIEK